MLADTSTTELSKKEKPKNLSENKKVARKGGSVAGKVELPRPNLHFLQQQIHLTL